MKITRAKLNAMLRSGLRGDITTRKQLAAHLGLEPTSLTRWFTSTDSAGNPRYPVVPDRHVTPILQLFSLEPNSLNLSDEDFRQHCIEQSLRDAPIIDNALESELISEPITVERTNRPQYYLFGAVCCLLFGAFSIYYWLNNNEDPLAVSLTNEAQAVFDVGVEQLHAQLYQKAIESFDRVSEQLKVLGEESPLQRRAAFHKGLALYGQGNWQQARIHYQNTLLTADQIAEFKANHQSADGARGAARGQLELGQAHLAFGYIQSALDHDAEFFGLDHPIMADNWIMMGQLEILQNSIAPARLQTEQALQLDRRLFGEDHPRVAEDKMMLALVAVYEGEIGRANTLFSDALESLRVAGLDVKEGERAEALIAACLHILSNSYQYTDTTAVTAKLSPLFAKLTQALSAQDPFVLKRFAIVLRQEALKRKFL